MSTRGKIDHNQMAIVLGLRRVGAQVQSMASIGKGCPDLLVLFRGKWYVAEVKDGTKPPSQRRLTDAEREWHALFSPGVQTWCSLDDALKAIGAI
jgi:hypothetical protein